MFYSLGKNDSQIQTQDARQTKSSCRILWNGSLWSQKNTSSKKIIDKQ